jgi:hypothetical protein
MYFIYIDAGSIAGDSAGIKKYGGKEACQAEDGKLSVPGI